MDDTSPQFWDTKPALNESRVLALESSKKAVTVPRLRQARILKVRLPELPKYTPLYPKGHKTAV